MSKRQRYCDCGRKIVVIKKGWWGTTISAPRDKDHELCLKCWQAEKDREQCLKLIPAEASS